MRRSTTLPIVLIGMALAFPSAAGAFNDPHHPALGCVNGMGVATPRVRPRTCDTRFNGVPSRKTSGVLRHLRWRHWGARVAAARGRIRGVGRVRVRAYHLRCLSDLPKSGCAYSKLSVRGRNGHHVVDMPWGFGLWPLD